MFGRLISGTCGMLTFAEKLHSHSQETMSRPWMRPDSRKTNLVRRAGERNCERKDVQIAQSLSFTPGTGRLHWQEL